MTGWFRALGQPVGDVERDLVREYLSGLGIREPYSVHVVQSWQQAHEIADSPVWDRRWWDAEQQERRRLYTRAIALRDRPAVLDRLSIAIELSDEVRSAAERASARRDRDDPGLVFAATGAACEAIHLAEVARLADAGNDHPFLLKKELFAAGRWPLGILSGQYCLF